MIPEEELLCGCPLEELLTEPEELPCILEDVAEFPAEDSAPEEIKSPDGEEPPAFPVKLELDEIPKSSVTEERLLFSPETPLSEESEHPMNIPTAQQHAAYTPEESMRICTSFEQT